MRCLQSMTLLATYLAFCGCHAQKAAETPLPSPEPEKPRYCGKVEAIRNGKIVAFRDYAYSSDDVPSSGNRMNRFSTIPKGEQVAVLKVYWPTYGMEKALQKMSEKSGRTGPIQMNMSITMQSTSEYYLTKDSTRHNRYSLIQRGSTDAEHFGYWADNDEKAVEIALNYVSRFVVPLEIGAYLYEAGPEWQEKLDALSN